jgi:hypothetical protein
VPGLTGQPFSASGFYASGAVLRGDNWNSYEYDVRG